MGPYCKFCDQRCFVPLPANTPEEALGAYREAGSISPILATCKQGQAFEKAAIGWNYSMILDATKQPKDQ